MIVDNPIIGSTIDQVHTWITVASDAKERGVSSGIGVDTTAVTDHDGIIGVTLGIVRTVAIIRCEETAVTTHALGPTEDGAITKGTTCSEGKILTLVNEITSASITVRLTSTTGEISKISSSRKASLGRYLDGEVCVVYWDWHCIQPEPEFPSWAIQG